MKEFFVNNVSNYIEEIKNISSRGFSFFRGQGSNKHQLLPSLLRKNNSLVDVYGTNCDKNFQKI